MSFLLKWRDVTVPVKAPTAQAARAQAIRDVHTGESPLLRGVGALEALYVVARAEVLACVGVEIIEAALREVAS